MNNKPKWKLKLLTLLLLAGGGAAVWWHGQSPTAGPALMRVEVDRGSLEQVIVATGTLEPVLNVEVGSQISGNLAEILVDFNSKVEQGQVIARLDTTTFEANVRQAEGELESANAAFELTEVDATRLEQLRERDLVPQAELDKARAQLAQARAAREVRGHALERARTELARCTIYSPIDGIVISRNVDVGQTVAASMTAPVLFTIANDLREMHIHANVPEADIGNIREGQRADFTVDAYRETFNGRVIQVRNQPIIESHVVMYDTIIEVGNPEGRLKPGMTATVSIITDEQADVLRVPNTALRARLPDDIRPPSPDLPESRNGEVWRVVYRLSNGSPEGPLEALPVRVGMTDGAFTKVLEGLNAGDTLVTGLDLRTSKNGREEGRGFGPLPARF